MISSSLFTAVMIVAGIFLLALLTWLMHKVFKLGVGSGIVINLIVAPIILGALVVGVGQPFEVTIVQDNEVLKYFVFSGDRFQFDFLDGSKMDIESPENELCLVNNSEDTLVIECVFYGDDSPDNVAFLLMIEPMSHEFFDQLPLHFTMNEEPPMEVSTGSSKAWVRRYWLREIQDMDKEVFFFYEGETYRGQPDGIGTLSHLISGETLDGLWENGKFIGENK